MRFPRSHTGKIYDPVFLCMIGAVTLAVSTSILLRAMIPGPSTARASETPASPQGSLLDNPYIRPGMQPHTTTPDSMRRSVPNAVSGSVEK